MRGEVPAVDHSHVVGLHLDTGQEGSVGLLPVPGQFEYRPAPLRLVLHRRMLQVPYIELSDTAICPHRCEDIALFREMNIVHLLIVSNQLREDSCLFNVPYRAGGIDGSSTDEVVELWVPVE